MAFIISLNISAQAQESYTLRDKIDEIAQDIKELRTQDIKEMKEDIAANRLDITALKIYMSIIGFVAALVGAAVSQLISRAASKRNGNSSNQPSTWQTPRK